MEVVEPTICGHSFVHRNNNNNAINNLLLTSNDTEAVLSCLGVNDQSVLFMYQFGSRLYGNAKEDSDFDFVIVCNESYVGNVYLTGNVTITIPEYGNNNAATSSRTYLIDACVYKESSFLLALQEHYIFILLALYIPDQFIWRPKDYKMNFVLNIPKLRSCVSSESHRTWVKARKKWTIENNKPLGKKNIVNAIRELMFGIQIAKNGSIVDLAAANELKKEVMEDETDDWTHYEKKFKPLFKQLHKELKVVAPKQKSENIVHRHIYN